MAGSDLGAITGLTSGAITGVVARLERAGYLRPEPDPLDGRRQDSPFGTAAVAHT
jgi:DNA-binding MarR family transcriptional regulator